MTMQIPQFFINPLEAARQAEQVKLANYQNVLAEQAIGDEQQKRAGYEAAYKNWLTPQQTQQVGVIEPTSAIQQLYGGTAQPVPEPQEPQAFLPQPYTPPEGSNYAYIQGANEANEVFQKQQQEYYTQNIAPRISEFIKTGNNDGYQKLRGLLMETENPVAGFSKSIISLFGDSSVPTPGKVSRVPMTDELRQVLLPMAANPAIKAAIETLPVGELADVDMVGDNITNFTSPREYGAGTSTFTKTIEIDGKPTEVLFDKTSGEQIKVLGPAKRGAGASGYGSEVPDTDIQSMAKAVAEGRLTIDKVPAFRGVRARVVAALEQGKLGKDVAPVHYTGDVAAAQAAKTSKVFVTKQLDMSNSFIDTIDLNIDQFNKHIEDMATRHNVDRGKIMNMGVREYLKRFEGDADINIYDMLINAISTENAKLVSGGAGSVAQVAEGARTEMEKIHDKNMPIKEMQKLLKATRQEGSNRIVALERQMERSTKRTTETRPLSVPPQLVAAMTKEIKGRLANQKVKAGDDITFKWKDGKKYKVTVGANGSFSNWKFIE